MREGECAKKSRCGGGCAVSRRDGGGPSTASFRPSSRLLRASNLRLGRVRAYARRMAELTVEYPDELLLASGQPRGEIERELKFQLAVRLFEVGRLSLGKAAEFAGWNRVVFADALGRAKVPVVNLDNEEIQAELRALRGNHHR